MEFKLINLILFGFIIFVMNFEFKLEYIFLKIGNLYNVI